jgi:hypothetical protein
MGQYGAFCLQYTPSIFFLLLALTFLFIFDHLFYSKTLDNPALRSISNEFKVEGLARGIRSCKTLFFLILYTPSIPKYLTFDLHNFDH